MDTKDKARSRAGPLMDLFERHMRGAVCAGGQEWGRLMDSVIRAGHQKRRSGSEAIGRQWALVDTRGSDPGAYLIREWTDANGVSRPVEVPPWRRQGGAIGMYTLDSACIASGRVAPGVDQGAGLLLVGFESIVALPLPARAWEVLHANWVVVLSGRSEDFCDAEIQRIFLLTWAILHEGSSNKATRPGSPAESRTVATSDARLPTRRLRSG